MKYLRDAPHLRRISLLSGVYLGLFTVSYAWSTAGVLAAFWLAFIAALALFDWRGLTSLAGLIRWRALGPFQTGAVAGLLLCFFPVAVGIYLARAMGISMAEGKRIHDERPAQIAELERELGL